MRRDTALAVGAGALLGAAYFAYYLDARTLDPREYGWIMNGSDIRIEYSGWQFFRREPWQFPPGRISGLVHPVGTSIANMDSIPMLGIALKPFHAWLPADFQYFGAWHLLCLVLLGVFAALLMNLTAAAWPVRLAGIALFLGSPLTMPSGDNPALASFTWMSLAGFWLYFRPPAQSTPRRDLALWAALGVVAAGINAYVCLTMLALTAAFFLRRWWVDRVLTPFQAAAALLLVIAVVLLTWWLEGYFVVSRYRDLLGGDLGLWSMNLLAPFNPLGWSRVIGDVRLATNGQYEGFAYFGIGILCLVQGVIVSLLVRPPRRADLVEAAPLLLVAAALTVLAISPKITFGERILFELPRAPFAPFAPFRASGRFAQPVFYLLLFLVTRRVARHLPPVTATAVLVATLAVQWFDLSGHLAYIRHTTHLPSRYTWRRPLEVEGWRAAASPHRHMVMVPSADWDADTRAALVWLAGRVGLSMNYGEPGRLDMAAAVAAKKALQRQLAKGPLDPATLYVVHPAQRDEFTAAHGESLRCQTIEGLHACAVPASNPP